MHGTLQRCCTSTFRHSEWNGLGQFPLLVQLALTPSASIQPYIGRGQGDLQVWFSAYQQSRPFLAFYLCGHDEMPTPYDILGILSFAQGVLTLIAATVAAVFTATQQVRYIFMLQHSGPLASVL